MTTLHKNIRLCLTVALATGAVLIAGCSDMGMKHDGMHDDMMKDGKMGMMDNGMHMPLTLTGAQEVPPVASTATGKSTIWVKADKSVGGAITTTGIVGTVAHIHMAPSAGANGPVIVPLKKTADNMFSVPDGTMLTDAQYAAYKNGMLYVNVHSAAHPAGEIRADMTGK